VQYKVKDAREYLFNVRDPDATLRQATESAVREIVGKNKLDFVITEGRPEVAARAEKLIQDVLDGYTTGVLVVKLNMQDAQPPQQVQAAFDDAIKAREDEQRQINEAEAYANDIIPRARGTSARRVQEAEAYREEIIQKAQGESDRFLKVLTEYNKAPEVTRERLYLEAMESVMANSNKVMVDIKEGGSLMYLPIDKMMQSQPRSSVSTPNETTSIVPNEVTTEQESRLRDRLRSREVR
jgi:membrane protease subunit HflK